MRIAVFDAVDLLYNSIRCSEEFLENLEDHMGRHGHHKTSGSPVCSSNSLIHHRTIVTSRIGEYTSRWNLNTLRLTLGGGENKKCFELKILQTTATTGMLSRTRTMLDTMSSHAAGKATRNKEPRQSSQDRLHPLLSQRDHPVLVEFLEKEDEVYAIPNKPTKGHSIYCPIKLRQGVEDDTLQSLHTIPLPAANNCGGIIQCDVLHTCRTAI
eukprot:SM000006S19410  [mRNA]  locus=s6:518020:530113:- [translate_table: standard]